MAWRPTEYLIEGELDNTVRGKVTGWLRFVGMDEKITLNLEGDFHRDIRGARLRIQTKTHSDDTFEAQKYMRGFDPQQTGAVGDITAGREPQDYVSYPYIEWYSDTNGRVVLELEPDEAEVIGEPLPWKDEEPVSREEQDVKLMSFMINLAKGFAVSSQKGAAGGRNDDDKG